MSKNCINYYVLAEKELVFLLKSNDKLALEQLYHNYKVRLYHNMLSILKIEEQTEKLIQQVFVKLWNIREDIDLNKSFRAQVFKIAENLIYDFLMKAALNRRFEYHLIAAVTCADSNAGKKYISYKKVEGAFMATGNEQVVKEVNAICYTSSNNNDASSLLAGSFSGINGHIIKVSQTMRRFFQLNTYLG